MILESLREIDLAQRMHRLEPLRALEDCRMRQPLQQQLQGFALHRQTARRRRVQACRPR
jgi:hypothetical protein